MTLEQNQLQSLPDGICDHQAPDPSPSRSRSRSPNPNPNPNPSPKPNQTLGSLIVHTNQLTALPERIGRMPSLKVLFVQVRGRAGVGEG